MNSSFEPAVDFKNSRHELRLLSGPKRFGLLNLSFFLFQCGLKAWHLVECLPNKHETWAGSPAPHKVSMKTHTYDPSTEKVEARRSEIPCGPILAW